MTGEYCTIYVHGISWLFDRCYNVHSQQYEVLIELT